MLDTAITLPYSVVMASTTKGSQMNIYPEITRLESIVRELHDIMAAVEDDVLDNDEASAAIQEVRDQLEDVLADLDV
jgi:hypothetical protein